MKRLITIFLLSLALLSTSAVVSYAQTSERPLLKETVRKELERTDVVIERAKEVMRNANAPIANQALISAISIQKKAWEQFQLDFLRIARKLTFEARELAKQSMARARVAENGEKELSRKLDRADEAVERIEQNNVQNENSAFASLLQFTKENLRRAHELYNTQQYLPAYRLTEQVERSIWRLNRAVKRDGRWFEQYENRAMQVSDLLDRTKDDIDDCDNASAKTLLSQAQESFNRAEQLADKDQLRPALQSLQKAQQMANDAANLCQGPSSLEAIYHRLSVKADKLHDQLTAQDEIARKLIDQANEQLQIARRQLDLKHLDQASAALRAAQLALRQADEYLDQNKH